MAAHGDKKATDKLKKNLQDQLYRLFLYLQDLEELREELEDDEYDEIHKDTTEQMEEIETYLNKLMEGNLGLTTELGAMKMAIHAAIKRAFKTPAVIALFAQKEPKALRERLRQLGEDRKLGRIGEEDYNLQSLEIVLALKKLGEELLPEEKAIVERSSESMQQFQAANEELGEEVIGMAGEGVRAAAAGGGDGR